MTAWSKSERWYDATRRIASTSALSISVTGRGLEMEDILIAVGESRVGYSGMKLDLDPVIEVKKLVRMERREGWSGSQVEDEE